MGQQKPLATVMLTKETGTLAAEVTAFLQSTINAMKM